jgi:hypothetical protein
VNEHIRREQRDRFSICEKIAEIAMLEPGRIDVDVGAFQLVARRCEDAMHSISKHAATAGNVNAHLSAPPNSAAVTAAYDARSKAHGVAGPIDKQTSVQRRLWTHIFFKSVAPINATFEITV